MQYIESKIINFLVIFIIVLIIIFISISFFSYQPYIQVYGEVTDDLVSIYLTDEEISNLNFKLKYNDEIFTYEIVELDKEYLLLENKLKKKVKIKFENDSSKYILELYLGVGEETNFWNYLYKKYMKGAL